MAVSSLTYFKQIDKPLGPLAKGAIDIGRPEATPNIAYYWSYQALDPVSSEIVLARRRNTPVQVEDQLVSMFKKGELATLGFWSPDGQAGHAVTPYAVEDKGNDVHWIKVYDNNFPKSERYIIIDRKANTWRYDVAAINPSQPKMPWTGNALTRSIVALPLNLRLKKAACPFCRISSSSPRRRTVWGQSMSVSITDQEGRKLAVEGDKITSDIPDAQILNLATFLEGGVPADPIFVLPAEGDYDIAITGRDAPKPAAEDGVAEEPAVTVFGSGESVTVGGLELAKGEKDTLAVGRDAGSVRYSAGSGKVPSLKLAIDDDEGGSAISVSNLESDPGAEIELKHDTKAAKFLVQGGGKASKSYDLAFERLSKGLADPERVEQKAVKFKLGESHGISLARPALKVGKPGSPLAPPAIARGVFTPKKREDASKKDVQGTNDKNVADPKNAPKLGPALPKPGAPSLPKPSLPKPDAPKPIAPKLAPKAGKP
jgi:hypothetical protein